MGDVATLEYPTGDWQHQSAPRRTVSYERRLGFLTAVPGYAFSVTYQLGGVLHEIDYANGVTWRQTADTDTGWERPDQIEVTRGGGTLWSTGDDAYDGAGNIFPIGTRNTSTARSRGFSYVRNNDVTPPSRPPLMTPTVI